MKTIIVTFLYLFSAITLVFSQSNKTTKPFTLHGKIIGQDSGSIILKYQSNGKKILDTTTIKNGEFVFKGNIIEPTEVEIVADKNQNRAIIFIEPKVMNLIIKEDKFNKLELTGSKTQIEWNEMQLLWESISRNMKKLSDQKSLISDSIEIAKDELILKRLKNNYKEIDNQYRLANKTTATAISFIQSHPQSFVSCNLLTTILMHHFASLDSIKMLYNGLDTIIQFSEKGQTIKNVIDKKEKSIVHAIAPDFKTIDLNNQPLTLSEFQGKNEVLLVFWASWCVACRESFPRLKDIFKKYHSKGLEIILVSRDDNKEDWITAVKKDSIGMWHQVHSSNNFDKGSTIDGEIKDKYFVQAIPVEILIDKSGKIIERCLGNADLIDKKLAEIF